MKIIFLDIDGVLNDWERSWRESPDYDPEFVPRCVKAFNRIIRETEAKIVLSSSWRYLIHFGHFSLNGFARLLRSHGVRGELIAYTRKSQSDEPRWMEIRDWLKEPVVIGRRKREFVNGELTTVDEPTTRITYTRYCIIDDDSDAFGGRPGIHTNGGVGLTDADADAAIELLNH